jgi:hypothetical protein
MFDRFQGLQVMGRLDFWVSVVAATIPWIASVPLVLYVTAAIGVPGDGQAAAGLSAIMAVLLAAVVSFVLNFFIAVPERGSRSRYFFSRSCACCVVVYTFFLCLHMLDEMS